MKKCNAVSSEIPFKLCNNNALKGSNCCIKHIFNLIHSIYFFLLGALIVLNFFIWKYYNNSNSRNLKYVKTKLYSNLVTSNNLKLTSENIKLFEQLNELKLQIEEMTNEKNKYKINIHQLKNANTKLKNEIQEYCIKIKDLKTQQSDYLMQYNKINAEKNTTIDKLYDNAFISFKKNQIDESKNILKIILIKSPNHINSLNLLAAILNNSGETEESLKLLYHAYEISKNKSILDNIEMLKKFPNQKIIYPEK